MTEYPYDIFRRCVTGVNEYRYLRDGEMIGGAAALVAPHYPVVITGEGSPLSCRRDPERTIFPGCSMPVYSDSREYAKVVYHDWGYHFLQTDSHRIHCISGQDGIRFFQDDRLLGILRNVPQRIGAGEDWELRQRLTVFCQLPREKLLLLLGFSLLQIGW